MWSSRRSCIDYADIARNTGATVVVPIYPLAPQATASTVVPEIADLIAAQIAQRGAQNVSVYGDSAGGGMAISAVQILVGRGSPTPSSMVLLSPWLDVTMSNPAIASIDDPVLSMPSLVRSGLLWAGDLDPADPLVSPIYGSLAGLPPTTIYSGSLDLLSADVLRLQDDAIAQGAPITFVVRNGEIHDWAIGAAVASSIRRATADLPGARRVLNLDFVSQPRRGRPRSAAVACTGRCKERFRCQRAPCKRSRGSRSILWFCDERRRRSGGSRSSAHPRRRPRHHHRARR
jgi:acetyl esterase/lipase